MYVWSLSPLLAQTSKIGISLGIFCDESIKSVLCCVNGDFWTTPKEGGWLLGDPILWLQLWVPPPDLRAGQRGWSMNSISSGQWFSQVDLHNEVVLKAQEAWVQRTSQGRWRPWKGVEPGEDMEASPTHPPLIFSGSLVSKMFFWVLWAALAY